MSTSRCAMDQALRELDEAHGGMERLLPQPVRLEWQLSKQRLNSNRECCVVLYPARETPSALALFLGSYAKFSWSLDLHTLPRATYDDCR